MKLAFSRLSSPSRQYRKALALAVLLLYAAAFPLIFRVVQPGPHPAIVAMIPVVAMGWLLGTRGVIAGVLAGVPLTMLLLPLLKEGWSDIFRQDAQPGSLFLFLIALGTGWLRDLSDHVQMERARLQMEIAERKRAEQALRDSEARYRLMVEGSKELFFYRHDAAHLFTYLSPSVRDVVGFDPEELIGRPYDELLTGDSSDQVVMHLTESALRTGQQQSGYQALVRHKAGHPIWLELVERPLEQNGFVTGVQGFARDITNRKQAEQLQAVLFQVSEAVHETPDLAALLHSIHRSLGTLINVQNFFVAMCEGESYDTFSFPYMVDECDPSDPTVGHFPDSLTARVARTGEPLLADSTTIQALIDSGELTLYGTMPRLWLGLPLKMRDQVIGVVVVQSYTEREKYTQREVVMMGFVAAQIALAIERKRAEQALLDSQVSLHYMAHYDALTQLPNRVLFYDRLNNAITQAQRYDRMMALMYVDLDNFKTVNDTFGHDVGDGVLQEVARRMTSCVRQSDTVARMGGDEFTVILTEIEKREDAAQVANKILGALDAPFMVEGKPWALTSSIGLSVFPLDSITPDELLHHADQSMYTVKESGKNNLHLPGEHNGYS